MISPGNNGIKAVPPLNGLVLAGGKSVRMGRDKGALPWHGKAQRLYMAELLQPLCQQVFISCRPDQQDSLAGSYPTLPDAYTGLGPYGAILTAFKAAPSHAWLITACDLPLLDAATLAQLIAERDPAAMATTFKSPHDGLPEPLITIWEPRSYPILQASLSQGYQCPRKALIHNRVKIIEATNTAALMNVNTPQELERVQELLKTTLPTNYDQ